MCNKPNKVKKLALNSQLLTVQILTNDVQVLILCLSYFITTVITTSKVFIVAYYSAMEYIVRKL